MSLALLDELAVPASSALIDVGGGTSTLVDALLAKGFTDVTVLDVSESALQLARERAGLTSAVSWIHADLLTWSPARRYEVWHDRAVFHFLVGTADRDRYRDVLLASLAPGGAVIMGTFGPDGPHSCSGLPVARYSAKQLVEVLGPDFDLVSEHQDQHLTPAGAVQPFTWVTARVRRCGCTGAGQST